MGQKIDLKFAIQNDKERGYEKAEIQSPSFVSTEREYYPAGLLAKEFNYAVDYVSWLARTGKVQALRKGKRWVVTRASLQAHKESAQGNKQQGGWKSSRFSSSTLSKLENRGSSTHDKVGVGTKKVLSSLKKSEPIVPSVKRVLIEKADIVRAVSMFILAGGLLLFYISSFGILKINFNKEPLVQNYQEIKSNILEPFKNSLTHQSASLSSIWLATRDVASFSWSSFKSWLFPSTPSPTYVTIEEYNSRITNYESRITNLENQSSGLTGATGPRGPAGPAGQTIMNPDRIVGADPFNPASLISDISSLSSKVDTLSVKLNNLSISSFSFPATNTSGVGPITLNPTHLVSETLTISGASTLANLSVSGDFSVDTNVFVVDTTNNRVGINNASPAYSLDVTGDANISGTFTVGGQTTLNSITSDGVLLVNNRAEFQGTASASYLLTGNTLQVGGFSSASYSRFGTDTTTHSGTISDNDDLLISGGFEVNGSSAFDGFTLLSNASVSGNFELINSSALFGINAGNTINTMLEVGGTASISGNSFFGSKASISSNLQISGRFIADTLASHSFTGDLTISKELVSNGTASNSFAGSLLVSKGFNAQAIVGTSLTISGNSLLTGQTSLSNKLFGINSEFQGTASASYGLFGTLTVGDTSSASYNKFGTGTTGHSNYISASNDLLISGDLETRGTASFGGVASVSGNFFTYGANTFSGTGSSSFAGSLDISKGLRVGANTAFTVQVNAAANSLFVSTSGNVGIGTTGPTHKLEVLGSVMFDGTGADWTWDAAGGLTPGYLTAAFNINSQPLTNASFISFVTNPATAGTIRLPNAGDIQWRNVANGANVVGVAFGIDNNLQLMPNGGNVGIGTTNPSTNTLQVTGSAGKTVGGTAWQDLSDARLKNVLGELNGKALDTLMQLRPIKYEWNDLHKQLYGNGTDTVMYGFVAQELMQVVPEFVSTGGDGYYWYNPSGIEAILTAGVQELNGKVGSQAMAFEILQARVASLSLSIDSLSVLSSSSLASIWTVSGLSDQLLAILNGFGVIIEQGLVKVQTLIANIIRTDKLEVGSHENPTGITIYDTATGKPYCLAITNGIAVSTPGECVLTTPTPNATPTPEATLIPEATPENTSTPEPSVEPTPEPTASPTPEITPTTTPETTPEITPTPTPETEPILE